MWKTAFKKFEQVWSALGRRYPFKFFKGCLSQIWLGLFFHFAPCDVVFMILFSEWVHHCNLCIKGIYFYICVYVQRSKDLPWNFKSTFPDLKHLTLLKKDSTTMLFFGYWFSRFSIIRISLDGLFEKPVIIGISEVTIFQFTWCKRDVRKYSSDVRILTEFHQNLFLTFVKKINVVKQSFSEGLTIFSELTACVEVLFCSVVDYVHVHPILDFNFRNWSIQKSKSKLHRQQNKFIIPLNDGHLWSRKKSPYREALIIKKMRFLTTRCKWKAHTKRLKYRVP